LELEKILIKIENGDKIEKDIQEDSEEGEKGEDEEKVKMIIN
jgi:hypothetical protein